MSEDQPQPQPWDSEMHAEQPAHNDVRLEEFTDSADLARYVEALQPGVLSEEQYLDALGRLARSVLNRGRKIGELKDELAIVTEDARTDELTQIYNRKGWQVSVGEKTIEALHKGVGLNFWTLDLDGFKGVNDALGHDLGDVVLQRTARILNDWAAPRGLVAARYGGDEFVMVGVQQSKEDSQEAHAQASSSLAGHIEDAMPKIRQFIAQEGEDSQQTKEVAEKFGAKIGGVFASQEDIQRIMDLLEAMPEIYEPVVRLIHDQMDGYLYAAKRGESGPEDNRLTLDLFKLKTPRHKQRTR